MAQYELTRDHYLHHRTRDGVTPRAHTKGEVILWGGPPSLSMKPLDAEAKKAVEGRNAERKATHEKLRATANAPRIGWTPAMEQSFMKDLKPDTAVQADSRSVTRPRRAAARN